MAGDAFQKFKSSLNRGVTTISVKTSSSLEKAKIKTHIDTIQSEIQQLSLSIGELAYTKWLNNDTDTSQLVEFFISIQQKNGEIEKLNEELSSIDARDNQILGNMAVEEAAATTDFAMVCPNCGTGYETPVKFCRKCGTKLME